MHFLVDFIPIALFFVAYKCCGIYTATGIAIAVSGLQVIWKKWRLKRFDALSVYTFVALATLGGATLLFRNSLFLKWKPTVVYWAMGMAFFISPWFQSETLVQKMFQQAIRLLPKHWATLNRLWTIFFLLMGILNLYIAYNYSTDTWVNFKLFGTLALTLTFLLGQGLLMAKYSKAQIGKHDASHHSTVQFRSGQD